MQPVARAHDRIRATFALVLGATTVLAGAVGRVLHAGPWPTELVVSALALALTSLLALVVVWPRAGQAASLGVLPLAALLGVVMMVWALAVPEQGPRLWPAAVAAAGGATTLAAFARWTLASGAHVLPRLALTPSDRYAVAKGGQGKAKMSAAGAIAPGDRVEVPAGQRVPTDGVVREGSGFADERSLTAAELAVAKGVGDSVLAGTTTDIPMLVYEARASYADSLAPRIHAHAQALVQAVAHAGVAAGGRVWAVTLGAVGLLGALGVLLLPEQGRGVVAALPVMAGVLLAVNASAPSVAARSALAWALVRAIHRGVLPREPEALRALGRVGRWEVDTRLVAPTGTVEVAGDAVELLGVAAALLGDAEAPDARVLVDEARHRGVVVPPAAAVRRSAGAWHGTVSGQRWCLGPRRVVLEEARVELSRALAPSVDFVEERSASTWLLARSDDEVVGALGVTLLVEPDVARAARALRATVMPGPTDAVRRAVAAAAELERDGPPLSSRDATLWAPGSPPPSSGLRVEVREPSAELRLTSPITCYTASIAALPEVIDDIRKLRGRARLGALWGVVVPLVAAPPLVALGALDPVLGTLIGLVAAALASRTARPVRGASAPAQPASSRGSTQRA